MGSHPPTAIMIEVSGIKTKLLHKTEPDMEVLSSKMKLEMLLADVKKYEIWKRSHPKEYIELEFEINHEVTKIDKLINRESIEKLRRNVVEMEEEIDEALAGASKERLSRLEGYLLSAQKDTKTMKKNPINKDFEDKITEVEGVIAHLKEKIDRFYLQCIENVENIIEHLKEAVELYEGTRNDVPFLKIHKFFETNSENIRSIDIRDRNNPLTVKLREVIHVLQTLRNVFNEKVCRNEMMLEENKEDRPVASEENCENLKELLLKIDKLQCDLGGAK